MGGELLRRYRGLLGEVVEGDEIADEVLELIEGR
jgi:hypothetical protein